MKKELKIGIFATIVIIASFFVLNYLRGEDIFNREYEYHASYPDASGLQVSAPVFIKGFKAGKVTEVEYDASKACFDVVCSVSRQFSVPADSRMVIYAVDIMGSKGVRIDLGDSSVIAKNGDLLEGSYEAGLMDALAAEVGPLTYKVGKVIDSLEITISGMNRMLSESNAESVRRTLRYAESVVMSLRDLSGKIGGKSDEITTMIDNIKAFSDHLEGIAVKADSTLAGVDTAVASINKADLAGTISALEELLENINDPDGTVGKLFVDDSIYNSVDSLLINIDRLVDKIQDNPKKYLKISIF